ncbi:hypothetical protein AaE_013347 [Aphanomyces astaci]|uniref:Core-binding (CB) domain-containing protein n=1 Tax=Aphanomyces astaci TaxID=112090 RepID=A0A6A4ZID4_APHAT|nr:hypothetical protein AaE_013347 [Aphanomyces astaci]
MARQQDFTIASARRNRISAQTRSGYSSGINQVKKWVVLAGLHDLLAPCAESRDGTTLDLHAFHYEHFLDFIEWTVQNKHVEVMTLSGYRSAIQSLYKDQGVPVPLEYGEDIKEVFSGLRKTVAQDLQAGAKLYRCKRPMSFAVFETLCEKSVELFDGGFAHLFLILSWNLMCRSKSTETVRFDHMSCEDDSIGFTFFKTKTNQEGSISVMHQKQGP